MYQAKSKRVRAESAKPYTQRIGSSHKKVNKIVQKTNLIQKIYANIPVVQGRPSSGGYRVKMNSLQFNNTLYNNQGVIIQKQSLIEQNTRLKKRVQSLLQELGQMNSRLQATKSKTSKMNRNLNIQFQNQNLWAGKSSYLVTGVKNQYQNLKQKYKQKCDQLNAIKNLDYHTLLKQLQIENEVYRKRNVKQVETVMQHGNGNNSSSYPSEIIPKNHSYQNNKANQVLLGQLQYKVQKLNHKLQKKSQQISMLRDQGLIQRSRIKFIQKLVIQKENSVHALHVKNKKLGKEKLIQAAKNQQLNARIQEITSNHYDKLETIKELQISKFTYEKQIYNKALAQKGTQVEKLEKEVAYLTTLLSYWKPLDYDKIQHNASLGSHYNNHPNNQTQIKEKYCKIAPIKQAQIQDLKLSYHQKKSGDPIHNQGPKQVKYKPRQQKRADKKRVQTACKVRNVTKNEVSQIGQLIRFRLIAQRVSMKQVFSHFTHVSTIQLSQQQNAWSRQYISMKQSHKILLNPPFDLSQQQSNLLSRYLIQDVTNDYIYCDQQNQNKRDILKSILKNIIGQYNINQTQKQMQNKIQGVMAKYQNTISTILKQMYPGGVITKKRLFEILIGSGFEIPQDALEYIVGKISLKSQSLSNLNYGVIF